MRKLTPKQQAFINALAEGKTQEQAYAIAYPRSAKWKRASRETSATKLLAKDKVKQAYDALIEQIREEELKQIIWTRREHYWTLIENINAIRSERERRLAAIEEEARLLVEFPPLGLDRNEARIEAARVLQKPVLSSALTNALNASADSLSKIFGVTADSGVEGGDVVIFEDEEDL